VAAPVLAGLDRVQREQLALKLLDISASSNAESKCAFICWDNASARPLLRRRNTQFAHRSNADQVPSVSLRRPADCTGQTQENAGQFRFFWEAFASGQAKPSELREISRFSQ
jgi:hypothetical protein